MQFLYLCGNHLAACRHLAAATAAEDPSGQPTLQRQRLAAQVQPFDTFGTSTFFEHTPLSTQPSCGQPQCHTPGVASGIMGTPIRQPPADNCPVISQSDDPVQYDDEDQNMQSQPSARLHTKEELKGMKNMRGKCIVVGCGQSLYELTHHYKAVKLCKQHSKVCLPLLSSLSFTTSRGSKIRHLFGIHRLHAGTWPAARGPTDARLLTVSSDHSSDPFRSISAGQTSNRKELLLRLGRLCPKRVSPLGSKNEARRDLPQVPRRFEAR